MNTCKAIGWSLLMGSMLFPMPGCGSGESTSVSAENSDTTTTPAEDVPTAGTDQETSNSARGESNAVALYEVIEAWESGDKDKAVELLLLIQWNESEILANSQTLSISEGDFSAMSNEERSRVGEEAISLASTSKRLARHALTLGDQARATGDKQGAKAHYEAVLHLGKTLSNPQRLTVLKMMGGSLVSMADKQIAELDQ